MEPLRIPNPIPEMAKTAAQGLIDEIFLAFQSFPDEQKPGNNRKYSVSDAACSAFSVFFTQSPSFLSFQRTVGAELSCRLSGVEWHLSSGSRWNRHLFLGERDSLPGVSCHPPLRRTRPESPYRRHPGLGRSGNLPGHSSSPRVRCPVRWSRQAGLRDPGRLPMDRPLGSSLCPSRHHASRRRPLVLWPLLFYEIAIKQVSHNNCT